METLSPSSQFSLLPLPNISIVENGGVSRLIIITVIIIGEKSKKGQFILLPFFRGKVLMHDPHFRTSKLALPLFFSRRKW